MAWTTIPDKSVGTLMDTTWYDVYFKANLDYHEALLEDLLGKVVVVPLFAGGRTAAGETAVSTTSTSYEEVTGTEYAIDPDLIDGAEVYFEANIRRSSGTSASVYASLYVNGSQIANSEVSETGTTYVRKRSGDIAADLPSGGSEVTFDVRIKGGSGSQACALGAARLLIVPKE